MWRFWKRCFPVLVWMNENGGFWKIFRYWLSCQWMRMLPSRWVPFSVAIGFSCGRAKRIIKHKVWTRFFLERDKNLYFVTKPDTYGRGLRNTKTQKQLSKPGHRVLCFHSWRQQTRSCIPLVIRTSVWTTPVNTSLKPLGSLLGAWNHWEIQVGTL